MLGFRGGYADEEARPRTVTQPARLTEAVGATYDEYTNLTAPVRVSGDFGGAATAWADALQPTTAETLAHYEHPHLGRWPAITTHEHGKGRVTYVGTLPDRELAVALARWLRPNPDVWADRPKTVTVTSGRGPEGELVRFVSNWSWEQARLAIAGRGDRCAVRMRISLPARRCIWEHGTSGCSWRGPRRRTTRRGEPLA